MTTEDGAGEVARFYTRSRRFPKVIGRLHDGTRIPGGPYTITQAVVAGLVLMVALTTHAQWGAGTFIIDGPVSVALAWAAAWGAGRIPSTRRNLVSVVIGGVSAALRPAEGRYKNQTYRLRPIHRAGGTAAIAARPYQAPVLAVDQIAPTTTPTTAVVPAKSSTITGVERLLQQTRTK